MKAGRLPRGDAIMFTVFVHGNFEMNMLIRLLVGSGLFAFGYYLGREVTRTERIREDLQNAKTRRVRNTGDSPHGAD